MRQIKAVGLPEEQNTTLDVYMWKRTTRSSQECTKFASRALNRDHGSWSVPPLLPCSLALCFSPTWWCSFYVSSSGSYKAWKQGRRKLALYSRRPSSFHKRWILHQWQHQQHLGKGQGGGHPRYILYSFHNNVNSQLVYLLFFVKVTRVTTTTKLKTRYDIGKMR